MALTQTNEKQLKDHVITGASFVPEMNIYDETRNYSINEVLWWNGKIYKSVNNITGVSEGDLSNAPHVSSDWVEIGSRISVQNKNIDVQNAPHNKLNFDNKFQVQDNGAGVATVSIVSKIGTFTNSSQQVFNNTPVPIQLANISVPSEITVSGTKITFNAKGEYDIKAKINIGNNTNTRCNPNCYFELNSNIVIETKAYMYSRLAHDGNATAYIHTTSIFNPGDVIEFFVVNNRTNNLKLLANESSFEIEYRG